MEIFPHANFNGTLAPPTTGTKVMILLCGRTLKMVHSFYRICWFQGKKETIMISKHGYYFFSKLIESVNDHQLQQIVVKIITLQPLDESLTRVIYLWLFFSFLFHVNYLSALFEEFLELMKYWTWSLVIIKCLEVANTLSLNV